MEFENLVASDGAMTELSQKPGVDRRRVVEHYRRADGQVMGALILRPEKPGNTFAGVGILCLMLALIVEVPYLGWDKLEVLNWYGLDSIRPYVMSMSGWLPLLFLLASMVIQAWWFFMTLRARGCQLRTEGSRTVLLLSVPLLGWIFAKLRMRRLERQVNKYRDLDSSESSSDFWRELPWIIPCERSWVSNVAIGLPLLASAWGILWLLSAGGTTGWNLIPIGLLLTALHGAAAVAMSEYLQHQLRAIGRGPNRYSRGLGLWAWFPAPLAFVAFLFLLFSFERPSKERLLVHRWRLGSSSVSQFLGASSRLDEAVERPKIKGMARHGIEIGSFCRLQNLRLFFEGLIVGCLLAPSLLGHIHWVILAHALVLALLMGPLIRIVCRLYEKVARERFMLRPFLIVPRFAEVIWLFLVGLLWGAFLWSPSAPNLAHLLLMTAGTASSFLCLEAALSRTLWRPGEERANFSWGVFDFLFSFTCAMSPFWGQNVAFGSPIPHLILYLAVFVAAGGFAVALCFSPWLLKPARWQDVWDPELPIRRRLRVLGTVVVVALPFSGLLNPLWQSEIDREVWPVSEDAGRRYPFRA